ncbi:hypothetical protein RB653_007512 [Dictyostelium firmibasis]|uniref:DUF985 domain-containing protein n=1 Tax=Dictyostelium firmibasis TaxID=79012 RepID=A0AAN7TUP6_9MYCE
MYNNKSNNNSNSSVNKNNNNYNEEHWIKELELIPHIEGGRFKEVLRSVEFDNQGMEKSSFSSIYYLLNEKSISHFHRLKKSDEVWYYHFGGTLTIHCIYPDGTYEKVLFGPNVGETLQFNVKKNTIISVSFDKENNINSNYNYTLVACMCCPEFQYDNFEFLKKSELLKLYPQHSKLINELATEIVPSQFK